MFFNQIHDSNHLKTNHLLYCADTSRHRNGRLNNLEVIIRFQPIQEKEAIQTQATMMLMGMMLMITISMSML
jgi:hypothetical protein